MNITTFSQSGACMNKNVANYNDNNYNPVLYVPYKVLLYHLLYLCVYSQNLKRYYIITCFYSCILFI